MKKKQISSAKNEKVEQILEIFSDVFRNLMNFFYFVGGSINFFNNFFINFLDYWFFSEEKKSKQKIIKASAINFFIFFWSRRQNEENLNEAWAEN